MRWGNLIPAEFHSSTDCVSSSHADESLRAQEIANSHSLYDDATTQQYKTTQVLFPLGSPQFMVPSPIFPVNSPYLATASNNPRQNRTLNTFQDIIRYINSLIKLLYIYSWQHQTMWTPSYSVALTCTPAGPQTLFIVGSRSLTPLRTCKYSRDSQPCMYMVYIIHSQGLFHRHIPLVLKTLVDIPCSVLGTAPCN